MLRLQSRARRYEGSSPSGTFPRQRGITVTVEPTSRQATFPWFRTAQEALTDSEVGIEDLLTDPEHGAVQRAIERIENALDGGTVGPPALNAADELCSYPVARVLVSSLAETEDTIIPAFAAAEARTFRERARDRIESERDDLRLADVVAEFDVTVTQDADEEAQLYVSVGDYLNHAPDASLTDAPMAGGSVPVGRSELLRILEAACEERVAANLPHDLPDALRETAESVAASLRDRLEPESVPAGFEDVLPGEFPPCLRAALRDAQSGEELHHTAELALVSFLTACGMDADAISMLTGGGLAASRVSVQQRHLADEDGALLFEPPSCHAMKANDCCVDPDDLCEEIDHPHRYYAAVLTDDDQDE